MSETEAMKKLRESLEADRYFVVRKGSLVTGIVAGILLVSGSVVGTYKATYMAAADAAGLDAIEQTTKQIEELSLAARSAVAEANRKLVELQETDITCRSLTVLDNQRHLMLKLEGDPSGGVVRLYTLTSQDSERATLSFDPAEKLTWSGRDLGCKVCE